MAWLSKDINLGTGLAVGIGAALLAPAVIGIAGRISRPLIKSGIKAGMIATNRSRRSAEGIRGGFNNLTREARAELTTKS